MIKYQAKASHMRVEGNKQGLVQFVVSGGPLLPEEEGKINWAAQSYQATLCYGRVLVFTLMPEILERSTMCLSTSPFQSVAMKPSGRKPSTSVHPSDGENSKGAGSTGRPGLGFLLSLAGMMGIITPPHCIARSLVPYQMCAQQFSSSVETSCYSRPFIYIPRRALKPPDTTVVPNSLGTVCLLLHVYG